MRYLSNIDRLKESNMGSIVELRVARAGDISDMNDPIDGVVYGDIDFIGDASFVLWRATSQTIGIQSSTRDSQEGNFKTSSLPFFISKDRDDIKAMLELAEDDLFVVLYKDANGKSKLFGNVNEPVRFKYDYNSGTGNGSRNGYQCQFYYEGPNNICFYDGDTPSPPSGPAGVLVRYNGVNKLVVPSGGILDITSEFEIDDFEIILTPS